MKNTKKGRILMWSIAVVLLLSVIVCSVFALREIHYERIQNEALAKLEEDINTYDENSIVLANTTKERAEELAKKFEADLRITKDGNFAALTLPDGVTIRDVYSNDSNRIYIEEMDADYQVRLSEVEEGGAGERLPTRPIYNSSITDEGYPVQTYLDYINMGSVWNNYTGSGITVAVIDTGIDTDHPEFAGRISEYSYNASDDKIVKDYVLENGNYDWSLVEDEYGHGTAVTGVIAGAMNNGGIVGVAPNVNIIVIKAEYDERSRVFKRSSDLVFGIYYAIERDVQVINMSFAGVGGNPYAAALQLAYDSDIICVASAGNESTSVLHYPAADEHVIGVGALANGGWELADYSNYGENVNVVAPGTTYTTKMGGGYESVTGTSAAAPVVTGAIALLMQTDKYMTFDEVTEILYEASYDIGDLGPDWYFGYGALDVTELITGTRGTVTFDMLTDELENTEQLFIEGHALQNIPEPERLYAVFDGWYYDYNFTEELNYYTDKFNGDVTLYAKWVNEDDGIPYTYVELDDGTIEIRSYTGHRRFITIPDMIDGKIVSSIGDFAFSGQTRLREVGLPSGLKRIGNGAFSECSNLVSMEIPSGVTEIGASAFKDNVRLSNVAFLGNSKLLTVGDFAFESCGKLERIELPKSLKNINGSAFYACLVLKKIDVQSGNSYFTSIDGVLYSSSKDKIVAYPASHGDEYSLDSATTIVGQYAFTYAKLSDIDLSGIKQIEFCAFSSSSLVSVIIPDSVTEMGDAVFYVCALLSSVEIGSGINIIPGETFFACSSLRDITIPNTINEICASAFKLSGLYSVSFEEGSTISKIEASTFFNTPLRSIALPSSVKEIHQHAFAGTALSEITFGEGSNLEYIGPSAFERTYKLEFISFPNTLIEIDDFAFSGSGLAGTVTVPASVTTLGKGVFASCADLNYIDIADRNTVYHDIDGVVYSIDNKLLHTYPAAKTDSIYTVNSETLTLGSYSFTGTTNLKSVNLPTGLELISEYTFYKCYSMSYITIPDNVMQIGRFAFAEAWNLSTITISNNSKIARLGYETFAYSGITSFTIPANVSTMAQYVFKGCRNLTKVTFAENSKLESISAYMFDGCDNLKTIEFKSGSNLRSIQAHGLEGMSRLTSIDLSNTKLENVDNFAFRFCENLASVNLPNTVTNIGRYAFYGCKKMSSLSIPAAIEHIGPFAFLGTNNMEIYFAADTLPLYIDEDWDHGTRGYYLGVSSVNNDGTYRYAVTSGGNIAILGYLGTETQVDLSALNYGKDITIIGGAAFKDSRVISVTLPETLVTIQAEAFAYSALESVTIPSGVAFIGREAFYNTPLKNVAFSNKSSISNIEKYAFAYTDDLKSVTLPASLTTLGTGVFAESGLESVIFEQGIAISEIPQKAFLNTKLKSVTIPDSVTLVNHNAFNGITELESVAFGSGDELRLMNNAFYMTGLKSLHIPKNVAFIGEYCFVGLENLTGITVDENNPNYKSVDGLLLTKNGRKLITVPAGRKGSLTVPVSVEEIGFGAFERTALSTVKFSPDANILTFGYRAFFEAKNITEITIPASVVSIDYYAFAYCEKLETVKFAENNKLKGIYEGAFCGDISLKNISLPDSIVEISDLAFYGCPGITQIPVSNTSELLGIYDYAFAYTNIGGTVTMPETLIDIGNYAFMGTDIESLTIPDTNAKQLIIGIGAFEGCNSMTDVTLPFIGASFEDEELSWFGYIFGAGGYEANDTYVPDSLKKVTITEGITFVGKGAFYWIKTIEYIDVPHSVCEIYDGAFGLCYAEFKLTNIIKRVGSGGLQSSGLSGHVTVADGITTIKGWFSGTNIDSVTLPDSIKSIEYGAFTVCTMLKSITIPKNVNFIGDDAFAGCYSLFEVINKSSLSFNIGSTDNGSIAQYAKVIIDKNGNKTYAKGITKFEYIYTDDNFVFMNKNGDYTLISYIGDKDTVVLPDNINGHKYTSDRYSIPHLDKLGVTNVIIPSTWTTIDHGMFWYCNDVENIIIPESITRIEANAFRNCLKLKSINIPNSVTYIGYNAFDECTNLDNINIPDSVTYIGDSVFYNCSALKMAVIGRGVNSFSSNTFAGCVSLENLVLKNDNFKVIDGIVYDKNITKIMYVPNAISGSITLPNTLTSIGNAAFQDCVNIENIVIPIGVTKIEENAFNGCKNLKNVVIPDGITYIGESAFFYCESLVSIDIPKSVTYIGRQAFSYCESLTSITIPKGINIIYYETLYHCTSLTSITIPDSVTEIDIGAFSWCTSLGSIIIPKGVTEIKANTFSCCTSLNNITLHDGIKKIGSGAFGGCISLNNIIIPAGVTKIEDYVFQGCNSLNNIIIPNSVTQIEDSAFSSCASLINITIPNSVTKIGSYAFFYCTGLRSITIPNSVVGIGKDAFYGCEKLYEVINYSNINLTLGSKEHGYAAYYAKVLVYKNENRTYADGVYEFEYICTDDGFEFLNLNGSYTLLSYKGEKDTVTLPKDICGNQYEIYQFSGPKHVIIPYGFTYINERAFAYNSNIESIVIPDSVTYIENSAFNGCVNLEKVVLSNNIISIGSSVFYECYKLKSIDFPDSLKSIGSHTFLGSGIYNDSSNWKSGVFIVDGWILDLDDEIEYIDELNVIKGVAGNAYLDCHKLKNAMLSYIVNWGYDDMPANAETLIVSNVYSQSSIRNIPLTLKSIILTKNNAIDVLRIAPNIFKDVSGITIYVEGSKDDLRLDDNFPGWNYGNKVVYGEDWNWVTFYDSDGTVLKMEPMLESQILVRPIVEGKPDDKFLGWDINGDGVVDSVPANAVSEINAVAVYESSDIYNRGDINKDGSVDVDDVLICLDLAFIAPTKEQLAIADLDGNGIIDVDDVLICLDLCFA